METIVNSLESFKSTVNESLAKASTLYHCAVLKEKLEKIDLKQFKELEEAIVFKSNSLDFLTKREAEIEAGRKVNNEDIDELQSVMSVIDAGDIAVSMGENEEFHLPENIEDDYTKLLSFANKLIHNDKPKYSSPDYRIMHEGLMTIISTTVDVYVRRMKYQSKN